MTAQTYRLNGKEYVRQSRGAPVPLKKPLRLNDRVVEILYVLFIHTYLTTKQVHRLVSPNIRQDTITQKLKEMCRKGWVTAPAGQRGHEDFKSNELYYQITHEGADALLTKKRISTDAAEQWEKLIQNVSNDFFHDAYTAYVTFSIHLGSIEQGKTYLSIYDILAHPKCPPATRKANNPLLVEYMFNGEHRTIKTDALCGVADPNDPPPVFLFIELDTGSEQQSTIGYKAAAYDIMLSHKFHTRHFGFSLARILFPTSGHLRAKNIARSIIRRAPNTADDFRIKVIPEITIKSRAPLTGHVLTDDCSMPVYNRKEDTTALEPARLCD